MQKRLGLSLIVTQNANCDFNGYEAGSPELVPDWKNQNQKGLKTSLIATQNANCDFNGYEGMCRDLVEGGIH